MSSSTNRDMTLNVEGFGPIAEAENVIIKPMTVFVGPSNTGKSYLATLLYAISRGLDDAQNWLDPQKIDVFSKQMSALRSGLRKADYDDHHVSEKLPHHLGRDLIAYHHAAANDRLQYAVDSLHSDWLKFASNAISDSITSYFQVRNVDDLTNRNEHLQIEFDLSRRNGFLNWTIAYSNGRLKTEASPWPLVLPKSVAMHFIETDDHDTVLRQSSTRFFAISVNDSFLDQFSGPDLTRYFPAARSGILASHRTLSRNLISSVGRSRGETDPTLHNNRIINDFLENLLLIHPYVLIPDDPGARLAEIIEKSLMNGEIKAVDSQYGPSDFVYSQSWGEIPVTRSSSMIAELAPIILALKHYHSAKHILIIEEPEAHLHPAAQQKFAAALALMVRNGFRVLITTHSHYMVEQISDFVAASNLSPEKRSELLRLGPVLDEQDIYLNEDEVGVYSFDNSTGSTVVKNIPFDESFAYAPPDHIQALTEQFNRNVGIMRAQRNGHSVNGHDAE